MIFGPVRLPCHSFAPEFSPFVLFGSGIWDKKTGMLGATGRDQVTSIIVLYGPRTTALVACDDGVYEFTCGAGNQWIASRERIQIKKVGLLSRAQLLRSARTPHRLTRGRAQDTKIFSPANMRAAQDLAGYDGLIKHWMENRLTLRYTGGLVPSLPPRPPLHVPPDCVGHDTRLPPSSARRRAGQDCAAASRAGACGRAVTRCGRAGAGRVPVLHQGDGRLLQPHLPQRPRQAPRRLRGPSPRTPSSTPAAPALPHATPHLASMASDASVPHPHAPPPRGAGGGGEGGLVAARDGRGRGQVAPFGLLVEKAGGKTSDGVSGGSVLDIKITKVDQRTAACMGSANEVDRFNKMVLGK
jgi:hypothetical protein